MTPTPAPTPLPTVHLGGTSLKMLTQGYEEAYLALQTFTKAFGYVEFNARDYYVQGPDAWMAAVDARMEINLKIQHIVKYVEKHMEHLEHVADQQKR